MNISKKKQFSSVTQSCLTLCDSMYCSTPGFPVHHQLPELAQTHVNRVSDTIQPSLSSPSPTFNLAQHQGLFQWVSSLHQMARVLAISIHSASMNVEDWLPLGLTDLISLQSKEISRIFSNTQLKSINSSALNFCYGPTLTFIHDYWKNHSFE